MLKTNRFRYVDWLAVEAGTSYHNEPYFFLLDEIDSFDHDELKKHISVFAERRLTFFWYKTNKGYHIISPSMLDLKSWDSARKELVRVAKNYYHHLVLRIEAKPNDSHDLFFENQDILQKHLVSASLVQLYERKFQVQLNVVPKQLVETRLIFTHYAQPELL